MASTGIAAKLLGDKTKTASTTVHKSLFQEDKININIVNGKQELNILDGASMELSHHLPRQLLKCQANYKYKITIDGEAKKGILLELDRIGVNQASMFGDADNIADYIMGSEKI